jgi:hypothetical protein
MDSSLGRRQLLRRALGIVALLSAFSPSAWGNPLPTGAAAPATRETYHWRFTGQTRCATGRIEELWCYYECFGSTCTAVYCEWRRTGSAC